LYTAFNKIGRTNRYTLLCKILYTANVAATAAVATVKYLEAVGAVRYTPAVAAVKYTSGCGSCMILYKAAVAAVTYCT
jgi:hypothetical protein